MGLRDMNKIGAFLLLFVLGLSVSAQDTRNVANPTPPKPQYQAYKKEKNGLFSFLKKEKKGPQTQTSAEAVADFRKRVSASYKENAKDEYKAYKVKRKEAKKGKKFHGHKRPPKKRPPGKQKFCKVCRIKH